MKMKPETIFNLDTMIQIAISVARNSEAGSDAEKLAEMFLDTFGESQPCGLIEPEVYPGEVIITREMVGRYEPREALAAAVAIIRGAIKAQEQRP